MSSDTNKSPSFSLDYGHDDRGPYAELADAMLNPELESYASGDGPLTIAELPDDMLYSEAFQQFLEAYGWPNQSNAGAIVPVREFADDEAFWGAYLQPTNPRHLNSFAGWLTAEPSSRYDYENIYGAAPALHRAYALAPEFFTSLRRSLIAVHAEFELADQRNIPVAMASHPELARGAHLAYQLLGRLIVASDARKMLELVRGAPVTAEEMPDITDAEAYLRM